MSLDDDKIGSNSPPAPFLAGVDDILSRCIGFCTANFILHASTNVVCGGKFHLCPVRTLILRLTRHSFCASGDGSCRSREDFYCQSRCKGSTRRSKSIHLSVFHRNSTASVSKLGTKNPDTHYVDVSRYSEKPVATLKALFQYWFDKAVWHLPSILILDNLDKLMGPEVEVRYLHTSAPRS